jgi:hypothetical protein
VDPALLPVTNGPGGAPSANGPGGTVAANGTSAAPVAFETAAPVATAPAPVDDAAWPVATDHAAHATAEPAHAAAETPLAATEPGRAILEPSHAIAEAAPVAIAEAAPGANQPVPFESAAAPVTEAPLESDPALDATEVAPAPVETDPAPDGIEPAPWAGTSPDPAAAWPAVADSPAMWPDASGHPAPWAAGPAPAASWPGAPVRRTRLPRNLAEMLTAVLLTASLIRLVAAVVGGILGWTRFPGQTHGQQVGTSLLVVGDFADGQGALLLVVALGLLWWQTYVWQRDSQALRRLERLRWGLRWLLVLAVATAAGALVYGVGVILYYAGDGPSRVVWEHFISSGGYALAYAVIAGGVAFTTRRLLDELPLMEPGGPGRPVG